MFWRSKLLMLFFAALLVLPAIADTTAEEEVADKMKTPKDTSAEECENPDVPLMTLEELDKYNGKVEGEKIYLSVLGMVYDVSKGKQHYSEGASYHIFAGRDGAVPFVTGNFTAEEAAKSTDVLSDPQLFQLKMWDDFYKGEDRYPLVGKVIGQYYDSDGNPTDELRLVRKRMNEYVPPPIPKRRQPKTNKDAKSKGTTQAKAIKGEGTAKTT